VPFYHQITLQSDTLPNAPSIFVIGQATKEGLVSLADQFFGDVT
jgi:hypothetical protein